MVPIHIDFFLLSIKLVGKLLLYVGVQLVYNIVLTSSVQQRELYMEFQDLSHECSFSQDFQANIDSFIQAVVEEMEVGTFKYPTPNIHWKD